MSYREPLKLGIGFWYTDCTGTVFLLTSQNSLCTDTSGSLYTDTSGTVFILTSQEKSLYWHHRKSLNFFFHGALRLQKLLGLLGTGSPRRPPRLSLTPALSSFIPTSEEHSLLYRHRRNSSLLPLGVTASGRQSSFGFLLPLSHWPSHGPISIGPGPSRLWAALA